MKKWNVSVSLLVLLTVFFLTSCQKENNIPFDEPAVKEGFVAEAKAWFANGPVSVEKKVLDLPLNVLSETAPQRLFARMGKMQKKLEWENAAFYNQEDLTYLVVPVTTKLKKYGNDYEIAKSLVFYKKKGDEMKMNVVEILSKKGTSLQGKATEIMATAFLNNIKHKNEPGSGINANVFFYDEKYKALRNYQLNNGNFIPYSGKLQNKKIDEKQPDVNTNLTETEGCQVWNVYLDTYDEWGTLIDHVFLFSYEVGTCGGDPNEDQLPDGEGGGDSSAPTLVLNNLTDPCKNAALNKISSNIINNAITSFYNNSILPNNGPISLIFKEGPVVANGPAMTNEIAPGSNIWETTLNNNFTTYNPLFMSQEAWGAIIAHEILHIMISNAGTTIANNYAHHTTIFNNFITTTSNLLQSAFGMTPDNATKLALNGLDDLWSWGGFEQRSMSLYGFSRSDFQSTYQNYTIFGGGTRCD